MNSLSMKLALCLFGVASIASAHGGGVDGQGGHNNRRAGSYHFHRGYWMAVPTTLKGTRPRRYRLIRPGSPIKRLLIRIDLLNARSSTWRPIAPISPQTLKSSPTRRIPFQYSEAHEQAAWAVSLYSVRAFFIYSFVKALDYA